MNRLALLAATLFPLATIVAEETLVQQLNSGNIWDRVRAINSTLELDDAEFEQLVPELVELLSDQDGTIRTVTADVFAKRRVAAEQVVPALIGQFNQPNGEEGAIYVEAVAAYGESALPYVCARTDQENWLIADRVQETLRQLKRDFDIKGCP